MKNVAVFCGARSGNKEEYKLGARKLGQALAKDGITLVYGGGCVGLMGVVADAVMEAGGEVIGVIPKSLMDQEVGHHDITDLQVVDTMHQRKAQMYKLADAFIALPGGIGTLEELFEVLTWNAIGEHKKPCGLLNIEEYYKPCFDLLDQMVSEGFLSQEVRDLVQVEDSPELLIQALAKVDQ